LMPRADGYMVTRHRQLPLIFQNTTFFYLTCSSALPYEEPGRFSRVRNAWKASKQDRKQESTLLPRDEFSRDLNH
jgi:hypothetical protein